MEQQYNFDAQSEIPPFLSKDDDRLGEQGATNINQLLGGSISEIIEKTDPVDMAAEETKTGENAAPPLLRTKEASSGLVAPSLSSAEAAGSSGGALNPPPTKPTHVSRGSEMPPPLPPTGGGGGLAGLAPPPPPPAAKGSKGHSSTPSMMPPPLPSSTAVAAQVPLPTM